VRRDKTKTLKKIKSRYWKRKNKGKNPKKKEIRDPLKS